MRRGRLSRGVTLLGVALAAGLLTTFLVALAGPGGQPPAPSDATPDSGVQVASVQLLPLLVADPQGGPPWGMRLLRTTRGWTCVQVGRVAAGHFGELGVDGAFGWDGRLHPTPPQQIPEEGTVGVGPVNDDCLAPEETFSGEIGALDRSAAFGAQERTMPDADLRRISFGLLGRHALAITYRTTRRDSTLPIRPPYGAYLIVEAVSGRDHVTGVGAAPGSDRPSHLQAAGLTGALTSILYQFDGKRCREIRYGRSCTDPA